MRSMGDMEAFRRVCAEAVAILDSSLGMRACGMVVSGAGTPRFMCDESPFDLTRRSLVSPMMSIMGYGDPDYIPICDTEEGGTFLAIVPMNRPLDDTLRQTMMQMRRSRVRCGISTDGFTWILLSYGSFGPRVGFVSNLRPYYIEALDGSRFRASVPCDTEDAERFMEMFSR